MITKPNSRYFLLAALFSVTVSTLAAELPTTQVIDGSVIFKTCGSCHGEQAQGLTELNAPALAGQIASYTARQLLNFQQGLRGSDNRDHGGQQMRAMAKTLTSDSEINSVSHYIANLSPAVQTTTLGGDAQSGFKQYNMKCGACHGAAGAGNEKLNAPTLTNQSDVYLKQQFDNFRAGIRGQHPKDKYGRQMKMMSASLNDDQLRDVLAYLATVAK